MTRRHDIQTKQATPHLVDSATPRKNQHLLTMPHCPKGKPSPAPVTQELPEIQPIAATATKSTSWKLDGSIYGKTNINPPLAGISRGALNQFMGNAFLEELKKTTINATRTTIEEVANGVVHPVTKETITKYTKTN